MKSLILGLSVLISVFLFTSCNKSEENPGSKSDKKEEKKTDKKADEKVESKLDEKVKQGLSDANHSVGKLIKGKIVDKAGNVIDINLEKKKYILFYYTATW